MRVTVVLVMVVVVVCITVLTLDLPLHPNLSHTLALTFKNQLRHKFCLADASTKFDFKCEFCEQNSSTISSHSARLL